MKKFPLWLKDLAFTAAMLTLSFAVSLLLQNLFDIPDPITTIFVFAVFLISLVTDGYVYGIAAALISVLLVNYAFTFPYFALNFTIPANFISALFMTVISLLTSALTTKIKQQEAMKAEGELERMRANLLRAVSHDLRTPLTTIYGSSSALLENSDSLTEAQQARMLHGICEDSQWLIGMVENLLSITRIDAANVKLIKTPTVLDELIDSVIRKFHKRYPNQGVQLDLPEQIVMIPMDPILMEQVIHNILENAVQHSKGMTQLRLGVHERDGKAVFEIADNGCGISPERLPRIFSGYYDSKDQAPDSKKRNAGIGLSVCATIIRAHGGTISAENAPSGGAVFRFTLNTEDTIDEQ